MRILKNNLKELAIFAALGLLTMLVFLFLMLNAETFRLINVWAVRAIAVFAIVGNFAAHYFAGKRLFLQKEGVIGALTSFTVVTLCFIIFIVAGAGSYPFNPFNGFRSVFDFCMCFMFMLFSPGFLICELLWVNGGTQEAIVYSLVFLLSIGVQFISVFGKKQRR